MVNKVNSFNNMDYKSKGSTNNVDINKKENSYLRGRQSFEFDKYVTNAINKNVKISEHANQRLSSRNITLSETDMKNINNAINKVESKGAKEALILYNDLALIASIKNRTIITAMDKKSMNENVFTNIDSAIIL